MKGWYSQDEKYTVFQLFKVIKRVEYATNLFIVSYAVHIQWTGNVFIM